MKKMILGLILFFLPTVTVAIDRNINVYIQGSMQCSDGSSSPIPYDYYIMIHGAGNKVIVLKSLIGERMLQQFMQLKLASINRIPKSCTITVAEIYSGKIIHIKQQVGRISAESN